MSTTATLNHMAKKQNKPKSGRARDTGDAVPLNIELPPSIDTAIEQYKVTHGPTKKWIVIRALEEFLAKAGIKPIEPREDTK